MAKTGTIRHVNALGRLRRPRATGERLAFYAAVNHHTAPASDAVARARRRSCALLAAR